MEQIGELTEEIKKIEEDVKQIEDDSKKINCYAIFDLMPCPEGTYNNADGYNGHRSQRFNSGRPNQIWKVCGIDSALQSDMKFLGYMPESKLMIVMLFSFVCSMYRRRLIKISRISTHGQCRRELYLNCSRGQNQAVVFLPCTCNSCSAANMAVCIFTDTIQILDNV